MTLDIHHLGLSVTSLDEGKAFFVDLLGWTVVREDKTYPSLFVSNGSVMITLWQVSGATAVVPFDRKSNVGLHHFAIRVASYDLLMALYEKFVASCFEIDAEPSTLRAGPATHFFVHGPSRVRIEFIFIPQEHETTSACH